MKIDNNNYKTQKQQKILFGMKRMIISLSRSRSLSSLLLALTQNRLQSYLMMYRDQSLSLSHSHLILGSKIKTILIKSQISWNN